MQQSGEICEHPALGCSVVNMGQFFSTAANAVWISSSVQRSVYKDLVLLLQKEKHLTHEQLRSKVSHAWRSNITTFKYKYYKSLF